ncbi:peptide-N(4)-(N-acetyl-beta-glucosaminyl)asparagine amidase-like isoform X2 [Papaver somniferum]|uniref:peptide-N(4)-(N-acetyl-beta- glucosaminyl)asparagine amidase-like isoform X2 n=1 Tax=Papaver somniferum TaxID=3469 RepID=UPI000E6FEE9A|nr:peptide-N(4)-(N-acetyl-beta-glucosaminyl)asparagine amidase-like isoform X2 [Papaver somniferum]
MVARKFLLHHNQSLFDLHYDTEDGLEVLKFQIFSLTSVPPDDQKAEEEALFFQQFRANDNSRQQFEDRVRPYVTQALMYEDPTRQQAARKMVPVDELEEKALVSLAKEGNFKPSKAEQDHAFLLQLLFWFKQSFRWVNAPPCDGCGSGTINCGMTNGLPSEIQYGGSRVELYRCSSCSRVTRFPRYNDPLKLVETRRGRCGEWANCFTLYCRAFGYDTRLILDFTDHVWTECFSHSLGRWMHLDPCEGVYDKPLLYEKGWNKNLSYVIAFDQNGVHDVTKRYTRKWHEVLTRRIITTEEIVSDVLHDITKERRRGLTSQALSVLEDVDRSEAEKLERDLHSPDGSSMSLPGRQSGAKEWRISRSEISSDDNDSLSYSSCPVRTCVDDHVSKTYNSFSVLISHIVDSGRSKSETLETLEKIKGILADLSNSSFKMRKTSIKSESSVLEVFGPPVMPAIENLLASLSLKIELSTDGELSICLAGDPVKTCLALPVALDALDDIIDNLGYIQSLDKGSLSLPLLKVNRISSGSVLASGEELPFGIVTSAFDGTRKTKWEEPNGAKGSWVLYKVADSQMHDIEAYEFMSANDAPERDPMDWLFEGSNDGGSSWHVLDKQNSQFFEKRFYRRAFKISLVGHPSNLFRFRFLAVRDAQVTSRLQVGSIDLYAKSSKV